MQEGLQALQRDALAAVLELPAHVCREGGTSQLTPPGAPLPRHSHLSLSSSRPAQSTNKATFICTTWMVPLRFLHVWDGCLVSAPPAGCTSSETVEPRQRVEGAQVPFASGLLSRVKLTIRSTRYHDRTVLYFKNIEKINRSQRCRVR